jgi:multiple sugar transport system substrate-binding protein
MKRAVLFALFCSMLLAACTSDDRLDPAPVPVPETKTEGQQEAVVSEEQGSLRIAMFAQSAGDKPYKVDNPPFGGIAPIHDRIRLFQERYPNVTVEIVDVKERADYIELFASEEPLPDIIELNPDQLRYLAGGRLLDLTPYLDLSFVDWSDAYYTLMEKGRTDERLFMLPVRAEPLVAYYNQDVFTALNMNPPQEDWTWNGYSELASRLKANGYIAGISPELMDVEPIVRGFGGVYASLDSDATVHAFEMLNGIQGDRIYITPHDSSPELALGIGRPSLFLPSVRSDKIDLRYAPMPIALDGVAHNNMRMTGLSITDGALKPELAWALLETVLGETDEDAMRFVGEHTLGGWDHAYLQRPHPEYEMLLNMIHREIEDAVPALPDIAYSPWAGNPFQLEKSIVLDTFYGSMEEKDIPHELGQLAFKLDQAIPRYYQSIE